MTSPPTADFRPLPASSGSAQEVFASFLRLGCTSFGGPVAHLGYFRAQLVEKRHWCSEETYAELIAISQSLPGPGSSQVAFALGMLRAGWKGGFAAWTGFTLPSAALMLAFALFASSMQGGWAEAFVHGLQLAAVGVVGQAVVAMRKNLAPEWQRLLVAVVACAVTFLPFPGAALLAILWGAFAGQFLQTSLQAANGPDATPAISRSAGTVCLAVALTLFGFSFLSRSAGPQPLAVASSFYQAGSLVFGGGHVVLPLLQNSIVAKGWISQQSFLAGYGAAQALPGPLFTFAVYLGAMIRPTPSTLALSLIALISIFLPGILLMLAAFAHWGSLRRNTTVQRSLRGINASVVGILAAAFYRPVCTSALHSWADVVIAVACLVLLIRFKLPPILVVALVVSVAMLAGR